MQHMEKDGPLQNYNSGCGNGSGGLTESEAHLEILQDMAMTAEQASAITTAVDQINHDGQKEPYPMPQEDPDVAHLVSETGPMKPSDPKELDVMILAMNEANPTTYPYIMAPTQPFNNIFKTVVGKIETDLREKTSLKLIANTWNLITDEAWIQITNGNAPTNNPIEPQQNMNKPETTEMESPQKATKKPQLTQASIPKGQGRPKKIKPPEEAHAIDTQPNNQAKKKRTYTRKCKRKEHPELEDDQLNLSSVPITLSDWPEEEIIARTIKVSINDLDGKIIALYFSMGSTRGKLNWFNQELVELYTELTSKGENFEVVYIGNHGYEDEEEEFKACFSKMPWLAIPPFELEIQDHLRDMFSVVSYNPQLTIIDGRGSLLNFNGYEAFKDYDSDAYPFTPEKHTELKLKEDEQPLQFLLGSETRDFLIAYNGTKVPLSELEGKNVGVFFVPECDEGGWEEFIKSMKTKLEKIKEGGEEFELVIIPIEAAYNEEKMNKVKISDLEGRTVILYFAPEAAGSVYCNTCTKFLVEAYHELRSKGEDLEVVFVSFHKDEHEFNQHFSKMPWLALLFSDTESHNKLKDQFPSETFGCLPCLLVRDGSGDILCRDALWDLLNYGSKAYPFTNERINQVKKEDEILKKQPQNLHKLLGSDIRDFLISSNRDKVNSFSFTLIDFQHLRT
ncbi:hypothetical protein J5N97_002141 [Dioscorea zingiberensis]|uniref:protein-disulfide reductase n=1 Tax=Dioscorea zingiberensis TaxID=325984 RepID=A0A9D5D481_9LILI|nr:hypothetical protein J5N97_002141 [Dioscorea zingiberensis]